ncbi:hypothetical protein QBC33DRAFT_47016 [Phialemonium atrogriseum]|uniref:Uncharacterized protein n=1 Tax=Phialemonium atrogriseum TaxID=1093897 RepID=A0AAJ0C314_9PEZI|nr:uncharacterized protein QBC33DRAFT_47016 [Phialemonium atrogriseum]KAK1768183.1 hypothetical protein QBC33DRAFT_47016 [Phialemonium atrogriseum]
MWISVNCKLYYPVSKGNAEDLDLENRKSHLGDSRDHFPGVYFFFPETNSRHLEEVDEIFLKSNSNFDTIGIANKIPRGTWNLGHVLEEKIRPNNAVDGAEARWCHVTANIFCYLNRPARQAGSSVQSIETNCQSSSLQSCHLSTWLPLSELQDREASIQPTV